MLFYELEFSKKKKILLVCVLFGNKKISIGTRKTAFSSLDLIDSSFLILCCLFSFSDENLSDEIGMISPKIYPLISSQAALSKQEIH